MIHTRYVPPHPQKGTPYHRYVILLLPQESTTERLAIPVPTDAERLSFNVREFTEKYGMDGGKGGAAHMWREVWDEQVSDIYAETLSAYFHSHLKVAALTSAFRRTGRTEIHFTSQTGSLRGYQRRKEIRQVILSFHTIGRKPSSHLIIEVIASACAGFSFMCSFKIVYMAFNPSLLYRI